ncbi:leucine-rich repeat extensin-like protein 1 isoform X2 [Ostrinia furnacalis]|uniref:leucine-rich repeat extensin-like protein 1 isoform X2 n=1 Tax=Ostrinia furnacalis TaxID=93504 RepID=UPI00103AE892|nr:leucine-rich repeat extensin-like protein 1 isoform X2 [Ostrinia furnacalis]
MALKSSPNKIPNSNHENDPSETEKEASSQNNTQSTRRKFKPIQKKNRKKSSNKSTPCPNPRTQSHAKMPMVPMVPPPVVPVSNMAAFYGGQNLMYPAPYPPWDEAARWGFHSPFYRFPFQPVPMPMLPPPPVMFPPVCPYSGGYPYPPPAIVPMVPPAVVIEEIVPMPQCHQNQNYYSPEQTAPNELDMEKF